MKKLVKELIDEHLTAVMRNSREHFTMTDEIYQHDCKDAAELEERYQRLELDEKARFLINDYIACLQTANERASDLAYMAGVADTVKLLHQLNVINGLDAAQKDQKNTGCFSCANSM